MKDLHRISIRAASVIGAEAVRHYCATHELKIDEIDEFCEYMESFALTSDIPAWDFRGRELDLDGMGEIPAFVVTFMGVYAGEAKALIENAAEIVHSQLYGAWEPALVAKHLLRAIEISDYPGDLSPFFTHPPCLDGLGEPVDMHTLTEWKSEANKTFNRAPGGAG